MNLFSKFTSKKVECPRCLGKGDVDWDDIKRLQKELKWTPGPCAYCNGKGKVSKRLIDKLPFDFTYLTESLDSKTKQKILKNDTLTIQKGIESEEFTDKFIEQVIYLNQECELDSKQIAGFFITSSAKPNLDDNSKSEFINYIERIIDKKSK